LELATYQWPYTVSAAIADRTQIYLLEAASNNSVTFGLSFLCPMTLDKIFIGKLARFQKHNSLNKWKMNREISELVQLFLYLLNAEGQILP